MHCGSGALNDDSEIDEVQSNRSDGLTNGPRTVLIEVHWKSLG